MNADQGNSVSRLRFAELRKSYGPTVAVESLSLEVQPGEIFGLIGPDGAGKTTAMRLACALLRPDQGTVYIMDRDVVKYPLAAKHHIGYMPQRFSLYPDLTVAENLRFFADLYEVPDRERAANEERLMKFSRLDAFRTRRAGRLSGGMKQKLALSCTLIHTPEILILDEPTTGVDPLSRQEFWAILRELAKAGHTLLVSTPYMDEAELCNRIALMHNGRVLATGTPAEVTGQFHRHLLEITGSGQRQARMTLMSDGITGISINRFGDRLHVVYNDETQERVIREWLAGQQIRIEKIPPTIEDVFVGLMETKETVS